MNFQEWYDKHAEIDFNNEGIGLEVDMACQGWNACKQEILKIIFLNVKQNGKLSIDIKKTVEEIEKI